MESSKPSCFLTVQSAIGSLVLPDQRVTTDLEKRLQAHNAGASLHTSKYRPWKVVMYLCFEDDRRAMELERYLKTGSGQALQINVLGRFWWAKSRTLEAPQQAPLVESIPRVRHFSDPLLHSEIPQLCSLNRYLKSYRSHSREGTSSPFLRRSPALANEPRHNAETASRCQDVR